jgi:uncharacterized C2H2 Zn-finger protein
LEVAKNIKILLSRVQSLRDHLELNGILQRKAQQSNIKPPKIDETMMETTKHPDPETQYLDKQKTQEKTCLIKCPHCDSKVRSDRLNKHINKVHHKNPTWKTATGRHVTVQQRTETITEQKTELTKNCENCAKKITLRDFEIYDGICAECYYRKMRGDIMRDTRRSGILGKDRNW